MGNPDRKHLPSDEGLMPNSTVANKIKDTMISLVGAIKSSDLMTEDETSIGIAGQLNEYRIAALWESVAMADYICLNNPMQVPEFRLRMAKGMVFDLPNGEPYNSGGPLPSREDTYRRLTQPKE